MMGVTSPRAEALAQRLASLTRPERFADARDAAASRLATMGLPTRRDEYWRYTDPVSLTSVDPTPAAGIEADAEAPGFATVDRLKLVFTDGIFDAAASDDLRLAGVAITRLAQVSPGHWAEHVYGSLEAAGQTPVARPLAALNSAYASDGLLIHVTGRATKPISVIYNQHSMTSDAILHHYVKLAPGAELTFLEDGPGAVRLNLVLEVELEAGAKFHHIRVQGSDLARTAVTHIFARLDAGSLFKSFSLTANGSLTRNEAVISFTGPGSTAHIAGAAMGDGAFLHDDTVFVTHGAERCESRQVFKKVLKHGAVGVFQGKILVKKGAQKTDGYQISQALLLDDDSQFLAKPELEIYADDVKCSHGSTSGAIDDTALFYLRSRGLPKRAAQSLLILAFLAESIAEIEDEAIAEEIRARLEGWLGRHGD